MAWTLGRTIQIIDYDPGTKIKFTYILGIYPLSHIYVFRLERLFPHRYWVFS